MTWDLTLGRECLLPSAFPAISRLSHLKNKILPNWGQGTCYALKIMINKIQSQVSPSPVQLDRVMQTTEVWWNTKKLLWKVKREMMTSWSGVEDRAVTDLQKRQIELWCKIRVFTSTEGRDGNSQEKTQAEQAPEPSGEDVWMNWRRKLSFLGGACQADGSPREAARGLYWDILNGSCFLSTFWSLLLFHWK